MMANNSEEHSEDSGSTDDSEAPGPEQFAGPPETADRPGGTGSNGLSRDAHLDDDRHYRISEREPILPMAKAMGGKSKTGREQKKLSQYTSPETTTATQTVSDSKPDSQRTRELESVILVAVSSRTKETATLRAKVATDYLKDDNGESISGDTYTTDLIDTIGTLPAGSLDENWCHLPGAARIESEAGKHLLEAVSAITGWDTENPRADNDGDERPEHTAPSSIMYTEFGHPVTSHAELQDVLTSTGDGKNMWLVPAVVWNHS
jgi:hypothetical protein